MFPVEMDGCAGPGIESMGNRSRGCGICTGSYIFSSAESVAFVGATPVFADVHEDTFNVDVESMERCIQAVIKEGKLKPKAMVVVDLFGLPADYDKVLALAEKYGLYVLEDCAQGFGSTYHGKKAGTFGHIAITSSSRRSRWAAMEMAVPSSLTMMNGQHCFVL